MGLCAGADNSFYMGARDSRVRGLILIDPSIPRTAGFHVRRALRRLLSPQSWWNVLSGRSLAARVRGRLSGEALPPPDYYGLLVAEPAEAATWVRDMTERGVQFLYVITGGASRYCNSAAQVREALGGFADNLRVEYRPDADHTMTRETHRAWLRQTIASWLSDLRP
jgi:pimeloyl-ACP methyl ester carboxylesterase